MFRGVNLNRNSDPPWQPRSERAIGDRERLPGGKSVEERNVGRGPWASLELLGGGGRCMYGGCRLGPPLRACVPFFFCAAVMMRPCPLVLCQSGWMLYSYVGIYLVTSQRAADAGHIPAFRSTTTAAPSTAFVLPHLPAASGFSPASGSGSAYIAPCNPSIDASVSCNRLLLATRQPAKYSARAC